MDANRVPVGSYTVNQNGTFDVTGISEGNYLMTVRGPNGSEIVSQTVSVHQNSGPVLIRMPEQQQGQASAKEATVSLHQLSHKVPKQAKKEFEKAARAGDDHAKVIAHLQKAIEIDPGYIEALNNLGSRYIQVNRLDDALEVLERAEKLDASNVKVQTNLAVTFLSMKKTADAERTARRAYQLGANDPRARYILALTLYHKHEFTDETVKLLRASLDQFPNANIALAAVYANTGRPNEARGVLYGYLSSGRTDRADQVRQMISMLPKQK